MEHSFSWESMIRGYHVYTSVWEATVGEQLNCVREVENPSYPYAVAVVRPQNELIVGHLPRRISCMRSMFLQREGKIVCVVIGARRYTNDLPQGGMEVPCQLNFMGHNKEVLKIQKLVCGLKVCTSNCEQSSKLTEVSGSAENANPDEPTVITDDTLPAAK